MDWCHKDSRSRLCTLLGLKSDFLDGLDEIPSEFLDHWTIFDWISTFLNNNCKSVRSTHKDTLSKELLDAIGFDSLSTAVETIMMRSAEASREHHIEAYEWAELFIKDELKYNSSISPLVVKFPFQSNLTNTWFQLPSIAKGRNNNGELCHVNIVNLVTKESHASRDTQSQICDILSQNESNIVLFHGTDHQSAADILERGIDLCAGRKNRDFSCGSGFYLTKSLGDSLNWAKSTTGKPAILVFQVDREYLNDTRILNLFENERRWREIVSSFRSGKRTAKTRKSLRSHDFIEGPMATVTRNERSDELVLEQKPSSYQMCLISDDFAEDFQHTLHSALFLDIC